jgi:hypothetical protein
MIRPFRLYATTHCSYTVIKIGSHIREEAQLCHARHCSNDSNHRGRSERQPSLGSGSTLYGGFELPRHTHNVSLLERSNPRAHVSNLHHSLRQPTVRDRQRIRCIFKRRLSHREQCSTVHRRRHDLQRTTGIHASTNCSRPHGHNLSLALQQPIR